MNLVLSLISWDFANDTILDKKFSFENAWERFITRKVPLILENMRTCTFGSFVASDDCAL